MKRSNKNETKRKRTTLLKENLQFPQISNASPKPTLITNTEGLIYYVNPAWEKLTGYKFKEIKGKNPKFLKSEKTPVKIYKKMWDSLGAGKSYTTEEMINKNKLGNLYYAHSVFFPIRKKGRNIFFVQVAENITQRKLFDKYIKDSEKKYRELMEQASEGIFIADLNGIYTSVNSAGAKMLGYTKKEIIGKTIIDFIPKEDVNRLQKTQKRLLKRKVELGEWKLLHKNGAYIPVEVSAKIHPDGRWQAFVRDITSRKELERQKDAFIGIASHELKTPLTTLNAFTQILEKRLQGDTKNAYFVKNIKLQANRLLGLIEDLLNVSRIESGKLQLKLKKFDLNTLIKKIITDFQITSTSHELIRKGKIHKKVMGDQNRLEQVIINFLTNAIKYSPNSKKIIIKVSSKNHFAIISIQDFGLGIAKSEQSHVFERFYRTQDKAEGKLPGFGLGLYISNEIIKRHKGKIWVESKKGKGSTFYFSIPLVEK